MRVLLDTHAFLWFIEGKSLLSVRARQIIEDATNERFLSVASLWETAIKVGIGKITLHQPFETLIPAQLRVTNVTLLAITLDHVTRLMTLPLHHRDPFDRLLIAQAMAENLTILSADSTFDAYAVNRLW